MHRSLPSLRAKRDRVYKDQVFNAEVLHAPGDGTDVPLILRLDEDDAKRGHHVPLSGKVVKVLPRERFADETILERVRTKSVFV